MIKPVAYNLAPTLSNPDKADIAAYTARIIDSSLPGFAVKNTRKSHKKTCEVARDLGFHGNTKASVPFEHDARVDEALTLLRTGCQLNGTWTDYGVTQLHADGDVGDNKLSAIQVEKGSFEIRVFERGPKLLGVAAVDLFEMLEEETERVLAKGSVDTAMISETASVLTASRGDTLLFNPCQPHMAITLDAPRHSASTFFEL